MAFEEVLKRRKERKRFIIRRRYVAFRLQQAGTSLLQEAKRLAILSAIGLLFYGGWRFWKDAPILKIRSVQISPLLPHDARLLLPKKGEHIFGFSSRDLTSILLKQFPELNEVQVRRLWDGRIETETKRRVPMARVKIESSWYGMDREGVLFTLDFPGGKDLPEFDARMTAFDRQSALEFLEMLKQTSWASDMAHISMDSSQGLVLSLNSGVVIHWGVNREGNFKVKTDRLKIVLDKMSAKNLSGALYFVRDDRILLKKTEELMD